jgi:membrane-associated phospholipid phosphatase
MSTTSPHMRAWLATSSVATCVFIVLAIMYGTGSPVNRLDLWLGVIFHDLLDYEIIWLNRSMKVFSFFGGEGLLIVAACVAAYLALRRWWGEVFLWLGAVGGIIVFNRALKDYFETIRPMVGHTGVVEESTGFPSGHAMIAVVTYGLLATMVAVRAATRTTRLAWMISIALVCLISLSRLFLTVHYLSDVLGGLAAGIAWLGFSMCIFTTYAARSKRAALAGVGTANVSHLPQRDAASHTVVRVDDMPER